MTPFPVSNFSSGFDGQNSSSIRPNGALLPLVPGEEPRIRVGKTTEQPRPSVSQGKSGRSPKRKVFSVSQILARVNQKKQRKFDQKKRKKPLKPIIPPKSFLLLFRTQGDHQEKYVYNRRILDYKHCGLLQRYIGLGGKILPRRQTKLTAKQQRYVAKTIKSARIMGLLPFVTKERGFFR